VIGSAFRTRALRDHSYQQRAIEAERAILQCIEVRRGEPGLGRSLQSEIVEDLA
jgi:hypothetical protein